MKSFDKIILLLKNYRTKLDVMNSLKKDAPRSSISYEEASQMGIVVSDNNAFQLKCAEDLQKRLENDGKCVTIMLLVEEDSTVAINKKNYKQMKEGDISLFGEIKNVSLNKFINKRFDYLYCMDAIPPLMVQYLLVKSKARCRVGTGNNENKVFFELIIKEEKTFLPALVDHLHSYSKLLK